MSWDQVLHRDLKACFSKNSYLNKETMGYEWAEQLEELRKEQKEKCGERNLVLWTRCVDMAGCLQT